MTQRLFDTSVDIADVFENERFFEKLAVEDFRQNYQSIVYGSVSRTNTGKFSTSLRFNI